MPLQGFFQWLLFWDLTILLRNSKIQGSRKRSFWSFLLVLDPGSVRLAINPEWGLLYGILVAFFVGANILQYSVSDIVTVIFTLILTLGCKLLKIHEHIVVSGETRVFPRTWQRHIWSSGDLHCSQDTASSSMMFGWSYCVKDATSPYMIFGWSSFYQRHGTFMWSSSDLYWAREAASSYMICGRSLLS